MRKTRFLAATLFLGCAGIMPTLPLLATSVQAQNFGWTLTCRGELKKNIRNLEGALDRLMSLRGVSFECTDPAAINELSGERIGVIAQEVEEVFPDWVEVRTDGLKTVTFRGFEALTVEALRELRAEHATEVSQLTNEKRELRARLDHLESIVAQFVNQTQ